MGPSLRKLAANPGTIRVQSWRQPARARTQTHSQPQPSAASTLHEIVLRNGPGARLYPDCTRIVPRLYPDCTRIVPDCTMIVPRLYWAHPDCTRIV